MTKFQINQSYGFTGTKWVWTLEIQNRHIYHVSKSFLTLDECLDDIKCHGLSIFCEAEAKLKAMNA